MSFQDRMSCFVNTQCDGHCNHGDILQQEIFPNSQGANEHKIHCSSYAANSSLQQLISKKVRELPPIYIMERGFKRTVV